MFGGKIMKRIIAPLLVLMICLNGCCVCIPAQNDAQTWVPDASQPVASLPTTAPTEAAIQETTEQTQPAQVYFPASVKDQYCEAYKHPDNPEYSYCVHFPTVYWNGQECSMLREQIYFDHMRQIDPVAFEGQPACSAAYALGQGNGVASVITCFRYQLYEYAEYSLFHVDLSNGQEANDDQVLAAFGHTWEQFYNEVRQATQQKFQQTYGNDESFRSSPSYNEMLNLQGSDELIRQARPFVDANGRLCALVEIVTPAGAGRYPGRICLQSADFLPAPESIVCKTH